MKTNSNLIKAAKTAALLLMAAATVCAAGGLIRFEAEPNGSKVRIDGTSTIHDWTVEGALIGGVIEFDPSIKSDVEAAAKASPKVDVTIPVRSLKSGKKPMDNVMYEAMKQKEHHTIKYKLKEMTLKEKPQNSKGPYIFDTKGELTVSGVTKPNNMAVSMERVDENKLKFTGTHNVKMTDFGIKPPSPALLGSLIKTGDDVKITFEWITTLASGDAKPASKTP